MLFAGKLYGKEKKWEFGTLFALCDSAQTEGRALFYALKYKYLLPPISCGIFLSSKESRESNRALALEFSGQLPRTFIASQIVFTQYKENEGIALNCGARCFFKKFLAVGGLSYASSQFYVDEIGYSQLLAGEANMWMFIGPFFFFINKIQTLYPYGGFYFHRDEIDLPMSRYMIIGTSMNFVGGHRFELMFMGGSSWIAPADSIIHFTGLHQLLHLSIRISPIAKLRFVENWLYDWNYMKNYLAHYLIFNFGGYIKLLKRVSFNMENTICIEFNPENNIEEITFVFLPRLLFQLSPHISINLYSNPVKLTHLNFLSNRFGLLFSYRIKPKSFLYIAFNDYREKFNHKWELKERTSVIKIKYLLYF